MNPENAASLTHLFARCEDDRAAILRALGAASKAWWPTPDGEFLPEICVQIADALIDFLGRENPSSSVPSCQTCGDEVLMAGRFGVDPLGLRLCPDCCGDTGEETP